MFAENGHLQRARLLLSQGRVKDAEKEISHALKQDPEDVDALLLLAECKIDGKKFADAETILHQSLGISPDLDRPHYLLGFVFYQQNNYLRAKRSLDNAISLNPYNASYFGLYAYILLDERDFKNALTMANEGLAVYAEELTCLNARSQALFRLKNKEEAYETIKEALAVDPDNDFTHTNYAWHFLERGKHKDARVHFREALRINPNNNRARQGYKESLKANLPPYRWMLMFSLWLSAKSKKARWAIVIVIWVSIQLLSGVSRASGWWWIAIILIGAYALFVVFSWVGTALANLMLLMSKEGQFVLTKKEKWIAVGVGACILSALAIVCLGVYLPKVKDDDRFLSALIFLTLSLPLSRTEQLRDIKKQRPAFIYTTALIALGLVTGTGMLIAGHLIENLAYIYLIALAIYTWSVSFGKR